ncbi:MAG: transposase [Dysgonamonadaceae bacterium]|nr:transposase [Dysgonamonadaceae bacterium]
MNILKKQRLNYWDRKKRHGQKSQTVADKASRTILCTAFDRERRHDFKPFRNSGVCLKKETECMVDTGYQGIQKLHGSSVLPKKKSKRNPLTGEEKRQNQRIPSVRITVENIIREVKIFRMIAEKYRTRRKSFALGFNLIAAIYNLNLEYK